MEGLKTGIAELQAEFEYAKERIGYESLDEQEKALHDQMTQPDFWNDSTLAQAISQQQSKLERRLQPWRVLEQDIRDMIELIPLDDGTLEANLNLQLDDLIVRFANLKEELKLSGPYDDFDVIL
jgi:peptide chain release factor 2